MLVFSIFVLLRGHNEPGGGFIGGLIAASAFAIYGIAFGVRRGAHARCMSIRWRLPASACSLPRCRAWCRSSAGVPFLTGLWTRRRSAA